MIDGYSHCGISKYRPVEDVLAVMEYAGVERAVLCQHLGEYDNTYLASVVAKYPSKFAAVCLVDPKSPTAADELARGRESGAFRGVRLYADWLREHETLYAYAAELRLNLVIYAPEGMASAAPAIDQFAAAHPKATIVVTHLGNPRIEHGRPTDTELLKLAARPGVFVQLSGLSMFCEYPYAELETLVRDTLREFGAERIYWGSNFPVCGAAAAYRRDLLQIDSDDWGLSGDQIQRITLKTAEWLWFFE